VPCWLAKAGMGDLGRTGGLPVTPHNQGEVSNHPGRVPTIGAPPGGPHTCCAHALFYNTIGFSNCIRVDYEHKMGLLRGCKACSGGGEMGCSLHAMHVENLD
jgi:hypothetical protein